MWKQTTHKFWRVPPKWAEPRDAEGRGQMCGDEQKGLSQVVVRTKERTYVAIFSDFIDTSSHYFTKSDKSSDFLLLQQRLLVHVLSCVLKSF